MLTTISFVVFAVSALADDHIIEPQCNYATGTTLPHYFPIGACESNRDFDVDGSPVLSSFRYTCTEELDVQKETFNSLYCTGTPSEIETNVTEVDDFSCEQAYDCSYAVVCNWLGCGDMNDTSCTSCYGQTEADLEYLELHCRSYITNECFGIPGFVQASTCESGVHTQTFYSNCTFTQPIFSYTDGGDEASNHCKDEDYNGIYEFYKAECFMSTTHDIDISSTQYDMYTTATPQDSTTQEDTTATPQDSTDNFMSTTQDDTTATPQDSTDDGNQSDLFLPLLFMLANIFIFS